MSDKATIRNLRADLDQLKELSARVGQQNMQYSAQLGNMLRILIALTNIYGKPLDKKDKTSPATIYIQQAIFAAVDTNLSALNVADKEDGKPLENKDGETCIRLMVVPRPAPTKEQLAAAEKENKRPLDIPTMSQCVIHKVLFPKGVGCKQCLDDYAKATGAKIRPIKETEILITDRRD